MYGSLDERSVRVSHLHSPYWSRVPHSALHSRLRRHFAFPSKYGLMIRGLLSTAADGGCGGVAVHAVTYEKENAVGKILCGFSILPLTAFPCPSIFDAISGKRLSCESPEPNPFELRTLVV